MELRGLHCSQSTLQGGRRSGRTRERDGRSHSSVEPFTGPFAFRSEDGTGQSPPVVSLLLRPPVNSPSSVRRLNRLTPHWTRVEGEVWE